MTFGTLDSGTIHSTDSIATVDHLTGTKFSVLYDDNSVIRENTIDTSGDTLSFGTANTLQVINATENRTEKVTDDLVVHVWNFAAATDQMYIVGKSDSQKSSNIDLLSGVSGDQQRHPAVAPLTTSRVCVYYRDVTSSLVDLRARTVDIADTGGTVNSEVNLLTDLSSEAQPLHACNLSTSYTVAACDLSDSGVPYDGIYCTLTSFSGSTPVHESVNAVKTGNGANTGPARLVKLSDDNGVVFYNDGSSSNLFARKFSRSGTSLTMGTEVALFADTTHNLKDAKLLDTNLCVIVYDETGGTVSYARTVDVSGDPSLNSDEVAIVGGSGTSVQGVAVASSSRVIVTYNSSHDVVLLSYAAATPTEELRYLGVVADSTNVYITQNCSGTLQFVYYDLSTLTNQGTTSFGAATYAEVDALDRGLWPVTKPGADQIVYIHGRDGNNKHVQYNDLNGTLGWTDVGEGTATWATAKVAVALMPDPLDNNDLTVAFDDNDFYRTELGTVTWTKYGDASTELRTAVRFSTANNEHLAGGTAAGTIEYTPNWGVSFEDVSGTALGTINWFEESR